MWSGGGRALKARCGVEALGAHETTPGVLCVLRHRGGKKAPVGEEGEMNLQCKCAEQFVGENVMSTTFYSAEDPGGFSFW